MKVAKGQQRVRIINSKFREVYENYIFGFGAFQSVSFGFHLLVVKKVKVETACIQLQW